MKPAPWFTLSVAVAALVGAFGIAVASWAIMLGVYAPDAPAVGLGGAPWIFAFALTLACVVAVVMLSRTVHDGDEPR
jgi:membrane protein implicated in regulation of membrane protease activity